MGYEVVISFFEKPEGAEDFDREDVKTKVAKLGDPLTEVPPDHLAAHIMKEFSRSDIWVENVEIFEWVKKKVNFKEAKGGGVLIGGKKYNPSLNEIMKLAAESSPPPPAPAQPPPPQPQQQIVVPNQQPMQQTPAAQTQPQYAQHNIQQQPPQQPGRKVYPHEQIAPAVVNGQQTYAGNAQQAYPGQEQRLHLQNKVSAAGLQYAQRPEVCDPPPELRSDLPGLSLTPGKQYMILDEQQTRNPNSRTGSDTLYKIINDTGQEAFVACHYFRQPQFVREEVSYVDQYGNLDNVARYVDQGAETRQHQPRLLYQDDYQPSYRTQADPGAADPRINNALQRMDAAVRRRTGR